MYLRTKTRVVKYVLYIYVVNELMKMNIILYTVVTVYFNKRQINYDNIQYYCINYYKYSSLALML